MAGKPQLNPPPPESIVNPLTASAADIRVFIFIGTQVPPFKHVKDNMNQQYLKTIHLHFVKSE